MDRILVPSSMLLYEGDTEPNTPEPLPSPSASRPNSPSQPPPSPEDSLGNFSIPPTPLGRPLSSLDEVRPRPPVCLCA
jgi:hypothetical protein